MSCTGKFSSASLTTLCIPLLLSLLSACGGSNGSGSDNASTSSHSSISSSASSIASASSSSAVAISENILFDDFNYTNATQMPTNGWYVRTGGGGPGVSGASWSADYVTFLDDPDNSSNRLMRMRASTAGSGATTLQSQITHDGNYLRGTYAARMYFYNEPTSGTDGDQIVETFYTITPLAFSMDPDYSEIDFEYLANGGWGQSQPTMFLTTWETYQPEPWNADNTHTTLVADHAGWRTLIIQVDEDQVRYYIDGILRATHGGKYYPETAMSINFNIWFIEGGLINSSSQRVYQQDVDWVYFVDQEVLSPQEVQAQVEQLREDLVTFRDSFK
ncbi:glycoside hydrolase family 16 protein [Cellvibrio sp. ARAG 10.3]|uniref:glycoside hydrolase family 16 protein n=1 Tax=Cellvibrio sp. ARAG 10.3 TaxID=3451358 RepID=UPI003F462027